MIWLIVSRLANGKLDLQAPSRFARMLDGNAREQRDTRTGRQIIDDLRDKLRSLRKG